MWEVLQISWRKSGFAMWKLFGSTCGQQCGSVSHGWVKMECVPAEWTVMLKTHALSVSSRLLQSVCARVGLHEDWNSLEFPLIITVSLSITHAHKPVPINWHKSCLLCFYCFLSAPYWHHIVTQSHSSKQRNGFKRRRRAFWNCRVKPRSHYQRQNDTILIFFNGELPTYGGTRNSDHWRPDVGVSSNATKLSTV